MCGYVVMSCYVQMVLHSRICPRNSLPSLCVGLRDYLKEVVKSIEPGPTLKNSTCTQRRGVYWLCSGKLSVYESLLSLQDFTTGVGSDSRLLAVGSWQLDLHRIAGCCVAYMGMCHRRPNAVSAANWGGGPNVQVREAGGEDSERCGHRLASPVAVQLPR